MSRIAFPSLVASLCLSCALTAQVNVITFEQFAEGTPISNQYAGYGVQFSHVTGVGAPALYPIIVEEGLPQVAFGSTQGIDAPLNRQRGLTDPVQGGNIGVGADLLIEFDPPVDLCQFRVIDIDGGESFTATFRGPSGALLGTQTKAAGMQGTGDGQATAFGSTTVTSGAPIGSVLLSVPSFSGWAVDDVIFARPQPVPPEYLVEEESAPGSNSWSSIGVVQAWQTNASAEDFYGYELNSYFEGFPAPTAEVGSLRLVDTPSGIKLFVVFDAPMNSDGGRVEWQVTAQNDPDGLVWEVQDDPATGVASPDIYFSSPNADQLGAVHSWFPCCTDGVAIGDVEPEGILIFEVTDTDGNPTTPSWLGLTSLELVSPGGTTVPLNPQWRVRFIPQLNAPRLTIDQPGGAATPWTLRITGQTPGVQYFTAFSFELGPGGPGSGNLLGLFTTNPQIQFNQVLQPAGTVPFNYMPTQPVTLVGPFTTPPMSADALLVEVPVPSAGMYSSSPVRQLVVN